MTSFIFAFPTRPKNIGGPATFQKNLEIFLIKKNYKIQYLEDNDQEVPDIILVIGFSFKFFFRILYFSLFKKTKIIQRLDGKLQDLDLEKKFNRIIKFKITNFFIFIFQFFANTIVYQSEYVKKSWYLKIFKKKSCIIYNGSQTRFVDRKLNKKIICIEGNLNAAYNSSLILNSINNYNIDVYGDYDEIYKRKIYNKNVNLFGLVSGGKIQQILKQNYKYIFISLEPKAPCPNSVIEAANHNIPIIGYKDSSIPELIKSAGLYMGSNKKNLINPLELNLLIKKIFDNYDSYVNLIIKESKTLKIDLMLEKYFDIIKKK